jgi:hypothetical protein
MGSLPGTPADGSDRIATIIRYEGGVGIYCITRYRLPSTHRGAGKLNIGHRWYKV